MRSVVMGRGLVLRAEMTVMVTQGTDEALLDNLRLIGNALTKIVTGELRTNELQYEVMER